MRSPQRQPHGLQDVIDRYPVLTPAHERELFAIRDRRPIFPPEWLAAREELVLSNVRLAVAATRNKVWHEYLIPDLVRQLILCVDGFDATKGFKFSTYAVWCLSGASKTSYRNLRYRQGKVMNWTDLDALRTSPDHQHFDSPLIDYIPDTRDTPTPTDDSDARLDLLSALSPREQEIIRMRLGLDGSDRLTLEVVGKTLGITKERTRQIQVRAMEKLRNAARERGLTAAAVA